MTLSLRTLTLATALSASMTQGAIANESAVQVEVYKSPTCGCCTAWVDHMEENGFDVVSHDTSNMNQVKMEAGLTPQLASCHTAFVDGYVIEGHVPASDIRRLLAERPQAHGLAVPGMPVGSPGMEMGNRQDAYSVMLFNEQGQSRPYASYPATR